MGLFLERRVLGRSGLTVSRLGLAGSYGIDADSAERSFHELSINHFFVSVRMKGLVEGVRRLIKAGHREKLVLQGGSFMPLGSSLPKAWEKTVEALGTDYLDIFQIFWVRNRWFVGGKTWPAMHALKEQGKVRALGFSTHERSLGRQLAEELGLDVLMIRYNAAHRGAEQEIFDKLGEDRPGIVAYTATRWAKLLKPRRALGPMSAPECYRFQLSSPKVDVALCGARTWEELKADAEGAAAGALDDKRLSEVRAFGDAVHG
jgi:aryl-alcohol dehydrogenase-like predicted oxidoreductase